MGEKEPKEKSRIEMKKAKETDEYDMKSFGGDGAGFKKKDDEEEGGVDMKETKKEGEQKKAKSGGIGIKKKVAVGTTSGVTETTKKEDENDEVSEEEWESDPSRPSFSYTSPIVTEKLRRLQLVNSDQHYKSFTAANKNSNKKLSRKVNKLLFQERKKYL